MADALLNIQSNDLIVFANKLEKLGKFELPVAVRGTLNQAAVNMKGGRGAANARGTIAESAEKEFEYTRVRNLFNFMTGFEKATGNNITRMQSIAGIVERANRTQLARGLAGHETGKPIKSKSTPYARVRKDRSPKTRVRRTLYLSKLVGNSVDLRGVRGGKFNARAISASDKNKTVVLKGRGNYSIIAIPFSYSRRDGTVEHDFELLYRINDSGKIQPKRRKYITRAGLLSAKDLDSIFVEQAKKRFEKRLRK